MIRISNQLSALQQVSVTDTAAKVQANWQSLTTLANLDKLDVVSLSDSAPQLTLKASQFVTGSKLLMLLGSSVDVTVSDTAANIGGMVLGDSTPNQVSVKDTAANVSKQWTRLAAMAAQGSLTTVSLTDRKPSLTLTAAQYAQSTALRNQLQGVSYTVKDTADNLAANADALGGVNLQLVDTVQGANMQAAFLARMATSGQLKTVKLTGGSTISLTAGQAIQMGNLLGVNVEVKDTATHIEENFNALTGLKKLTQITLTDSARPTLTVTDAQYKSGTKLLAKIAGASVSVKFSGNFESYSLKANTDGTFSVGNSKYKGVNFLEFDNYTTFADTGDANINSLLAGGTDFWWSTGLPTKSSNTAIKSGVFALDNTSTRHTFSYSFIQELPVTDKENNHGFTVMNAKQKQAVKDALSYLSTLINVTFEEVTGNQLGKADINFGTNDQTATHSSGYANPPNGGGDHPIYLFLDNSKKNTNDNFSSGSYGWQTLIHEIGHTLGLKHPGNYNASGGSSLGPFLPKATDTRRYTVMSYNTPTDATKATAYGLQYVYPQTYMTYDIAALQYLYGVGNGQGVESYQVNKFSADWSGMETLWLPADGRIDASSTQHSNIIDLRSGAFSSINVTSVSDLVALSPLVKKQVTYMGLNNVSLAYGSNVSSVTGGAANDTFFDAATSGNVTIDAGNGIGDVAYLSGTATDWRMTQSEGGDIYTNVKLSRTVTLKGIDLVRYYNASTYTTTHSNLDIYA